jgi:hypothetical protein
MAVESRFTIEELIQISTWARHGLTEGDIRILLGYSLDAWKQKLKHQWSLFYDVFEHGCTAGIAEVAAALHNAAKSGDTGAAKFSLERRARGTWLPPSAGRPVVTVYAGGPLAQLDLEDIDRRFAYQSKMLDLDGRAIDAERDSAAGQAPSAGTGKD